MANVPALLPEVPNALTTLDPYHGDGRSSPICTFCIYFPADQRSFFIDPYGTSNIAPEVGSLHRDTDAFGTVAPDVTGRKTSLPNESISFDVFGVNHFSSIGFPVINSLASVMVPLVIEARGI